MPVETLKSDFLAFALICAMTVLLLAGCGDENMTGPEPDPPAPDSILVDFSEQRQIIRGFGGATVFRLNEPLSEENMDRIFGTGENELGFSIHRIRVAPSSYGRDIELEHAQGAVERGAKVVAAPWSPPARIKTNNDLVGGSLKRDSFAVYAEYLNDFAQYMEDNGAPLYGISIQNEPDIEVSYESCDWTSSQMRAFLANHGDKITAARVMAPESYNFDHSFSDPILNDSEAAANLDIVAGHIYGGGLDPYPRAQNMGKELWMTEHLDTLTTWQANLGTGKEMHDAMAEANFNAYIWWYFKRFYGPICGSGCTGQYERPDREEGTITKRGYVMSHYSKFIRPGYHRVGVTNPATIPDVFVSAYDGEKPVIVALNMGESSQRIRFKLRNHSISELQRYRTTEDQNLAEETIEVSGNSFTRRLPPRSITTYKVP